MSRLESKPSDGPRARWTAVVLHPKNHWLIRGVGTSFCPVSPTHGRVFHMTSCCPVVVFFTTSVSLKVERRSSDAVRGHAGGLASAADSPPWEVGWSWKMITTARSGPPSSFAPHFPFSATIIQKTHKRRSDFQIPTQCGLKEIRQRPLAEVGR